MDTTREDPETVVKDINDLAVSILILMDTTREEAFATGYIDGIGCFNPHSNGHHSGRRCL